MQSGYKKLDVWKKGYELTLKVYEVTRHYPKEETYGLISQMRRASSSIIANLAEGYGRNHLGEYIQYVSIAIGSCNELEVHILLSNDLHYLKKKNYDELMSGHEEVSKMLFGLRKALEQKKQQR